ncbi:MAG: ribokinase, partial [Nitrospiraceae bacterium]
MPKVIVVGSANMDFTVTVDCLPVAGETTMGKDFYQSFGGKGANQAVAAHRAGAEVVFLTKLGHDVNGRLIEQHLLSEGLPPEGLLHHPTRHTGVALILVDHSGQNMIAVAPGGNQTLSVDDVRQHASLIASGSVLLAQLEVPLDVVAEALAIANAHRIATILNPAPAVRLSSDLLKLVDVLTPNEGEAQALTGQTDPTEAAQVLIRQGVRSVIVT